eukprot:3530365-Alexandrium_andersonii.AAC.1
MLRADRRANGRAFRKARRWLGRRRLDRGLNADRRAQPASLSGSGLQGSCGGSLAHLGTNSGPADEPRGGRAGGASAPDARDQKPLVVADGA